MMRKTTTLLTTFLVLAIVMAVQPPPLMAETWWDAVADGGFELGSPNAVWNEYSEYAGEVIMQDVATAHTGAWYASFGTEWPVPESAWLAQDIMLGTGAATISFWWTRPFASENNEDILALYIDGNIVWLDQPYPGIGPLDQWIFEETEINQYADGGSHQIFFEMMSTGTTNTENGTLWHVDDVEVQTCDFDELLADFYWEPGNPMVGEPVHFWDSTTGGADQWSWDFGDGQTSELQDPIHVFDNAGEWTVSLTATRTSDSEQSTKNYVVTIGEVPLSVDFSWLPLEPLVGEEVSFLPDVVGGPDDWHWDFGDGSDSDDPNPVHSFETPGEHLVILDVYRSSDDASGSIQHAIFVLEPLTANFGWDPESPGVGETVVFSDCSSGDPDTWFWNFGDGFTSEEQNPTHAWDQPGDYPVTLTISRSGGDPAEIEQWVTVSDDEMTAVFMWEPFEPEVGEEVWFSDSSTGDPDLWIWQFGDGNTSDEQNPVHIFETAGAFTVTLTVSRSEDPNVTSTAERIVTVLPPPLIANFEWWPDDPFVGGGVEFLDLSEGEPVVWEWNFGDGSGSSQQSPIHSYSDTGTYNVALAVTDSTGASDEITQELYVGDDPYLADFTWEPDEPHAGQAVEFFDQSQDDPMTWHWQFGDGGTSRQQHPVHWFDEPGAFDVTLTVAFNPEGTILRSTTHTIIIGASPLEADFFWIPLTPKAGEMAEFTDVSRGRPTSWYWDFDDGSTSQTQHPAHAYQAPGQYTISLTIERGDKKALSTDTRTRTIHVMPGEEIDFTWDPHEPRALEPVQFTEDLDEISEPIGSRLWAFGDSETNHIEDPEHIYRHPGTYLVQLWVSNTDGDILAAAEHEILVLPPDLDISLAVSNAAPDIGETIFFHIGGVENVEGVQWAFGGMGCDGNPGQTTCIPNDMDNCLTANYSFATPGLKPVRAWIRLEDGAEVGPFSTPVRVSQDGRCPSTPEANFSWWPAEPKTGQPVRCVDISIGPPENWAWTFDDGSTSSSQHATHVFGTPGEHLVELAITNPNGQSAITKTITVAAAGATCGNEICEPGENSWSCPQDCMDDLEGTGRSGRKNTNLMVPAAVGGIHGANDTYWVTEGSIINPGKEDAQVVVEFVADNAPAGPRVAGPATIPPRSAIHFDNIVAELFGVHASGSLWIDANRPVIANTRTFNKTGEGTFGQGIGGITKNDVLGEDDGSVYIIGLKQTDRFRTNFLLQEVSGHDATVEAKIFDATGALVTSGSINVPSKTKWQKPITNLGVTSLEAGYAVLSVTSGGKIAAMASVIDQITGDATSLDAVHSLQTGAGPQDKADGEDDESHFLVAVVARTPGSNDTVWRSEVSILNTEETDQVLELRYVPSDGDMQTATRELSGGELFFSEDVIEEVFPEAVNGAGSMHVYAQKGLVVNSRTYNVLPDESTVGQAIPGLADGDMARPGEVWLLDSLKQTNKFRCNMGFAEFEGSDAEVTVVLFDTDGASLFFLASKQYSVPAFGQFQVNKVFRDMGLNDNFREAIAYVTVSSEGGAVYAYASIVDNKVGDGTTVLGKRQ